LQSTGQAKVLQLLDQLKEEQALPPLAVAVTMERTLVLEPVPQDLVQVPNLDHPDTTQSTGQAWVLQVWTSDNTGQSLPPYC
jgi:hypothetical protein